MNRLALAVAALTLALAACSGDGDEPSRPAATGHNQQDVVFAQEMVPHYKQAVEMAVLAETRAASPEVKQLAAKIKAAQAPQITAMTGWLTSWKATPAADREENAETGGNGMMSPAELEELGTLKGTAFDDLFLELMIKHHQGGVAMAEDEVDQGAHGPAKDLAQSVIDGQTAEITAMEALLEG